MFLRNKILLKLNMYKIPNTNEHRLYVLYCDVMTIKDLHGTEYILTKT